MQRRQFHQLSAAALLGTFLQGKAMSATTNAANNADSAAQSHAEVMEKQNPFKNFPKATIGLVLYPGMFLQDLVGPLTVFEALMNRDIHLLWKSKEPVGQAVGGAPRLIPVSPTTTFAECPKKLDVLFVPGGVPGTQQMMEDADMMAFLQRMAPNSRFVTSVCTGSLILAAAGLLKGYKAASYWAMTDLLTDFGAIPSNDRVCIDRNRITGGGVTAGIDFGLEIAAKLTSPLYAQVIQLYLEYAPAPPFNAGRPETAPAQAREFLDGMYASTRETTKAIAVRVAKRKS
jgi:cyclohexyl-isocyanide hydratase